MTLAHAPRRLLFRCKHLTVLHLRKRIVFTHFLEFPNILEPAFVMIPDSKSIGLIRGRMIFKGHAQCGSWKQPMHGHMKPIKALTLDAWFATPNSFVLMFFGFFFMNQP